MADGTTAAPTRSDPRTFGGVAPRDTVPLARTPLNIPHRPQRAEETGTHAALGSASQVAADKSRGIARPEQPRQRAVARDEAASLAELEHIWGAKTEANAAAIDKYLASLPPEEARAIRRHSRSLANDPTYAVEILAQAQRPRPEAYTVAAIEKFMRTNRKAYNADAGLQERYRALIDERSRGE